MSNNKTEKLVFRWVDTPDTIGEYLFTFDGVRIFNMFHDYPYALTEEEKQIFDRENPYWEKYFAYRQKNTDETI